MGMGGGLPAASEGVVPSDGASDSTADSTTTSPALPGKLSFLNGDWINERVMRVAGRVDALLDRIIDEGLLSDGFFPFESPITDEMLAKLTPGEFRILFDTIPSLEGKAQLLDRMKGLKLPLPIELPFAAETPNPVRQLSFNQESMRVAPGVGSSV